MQGLSSAEVEERKKAGQVNSTEAAVSRSYADILVKNIVTPFNIILFVLGALLLVMDEPISAASATGIIIFNILISTIQEMRAKRRLDKIALLMRPHATVVRDGGERSVDPAEIVKDDVVVLRAGDQALVDGTLLECRSLEMDESLLTGESSTVRKEAGDEVFSGSYCVSGEGCFKVTTFGDESYASKMLSGARKFTVKRTPLQMETATISKALMAISFILLAFTVVFELLRGQNIFDATTLEAFVVCLDIVPIALFLLITLTYMIAAVRMADSGVLLQNSNSVESISHVDTVCMDKTGTITTNNLVFESAFNQVPDDEAARIMSMFATATGSRNRTIGVIADRYGETPSELIEEVQFSSARKYSAVLLKDGEDVESVFTGAWNVLRPHVADPSAIDAIISSESSKGLRTVVVCTGRSGTLFKDGEPFIPDLDPVSVVSIRDEVRPECRETIQVFLDNGMDLKVISGDDPKTVDALFSIAGIPGERRLVSGPELDSLSGQELEDRIVESNIFGRMRPENKEQVMEVLKRKGRYVAMIGDGVNDVKSLKSAQVGISLQSGAGAARGVADMILMEDCFSALPKALVEGRKTVSGMRDILRLYLSRNMALALMFLVIFFFVGSLPMIPIQNTFYAFIAVSIIAFFMTIFARPDTNKDLVLPDVLRFCVPSAIIISFFGLLVYGLTWYATAQGILDVDFGLLSTYVNNDIATDAESMIEYLSWNGSGVEEINARSAMVIFVTMAGMFQLPMICPWFRFLSFDGKVNRNPLPPILILLLIALVGTMYWKLQFIALGLVKLVVFPPEMFACLAGGLAVWFVVELALLKLGVFKRTVARFEAFYMRKLTREYTKNDSGKQD